MKFVRVLVTALIHNHAPRHAQPYETRVKIMDSVVTAIKAAAAFVTMVSNSNSLYVGAATSSDYFNGIMEMISFYSMAFDDDMINIY